MLPYLVERVGGNAPNYAGGVYCENVSIRPSTSCVNYKKVSSLFSFINKTRPIKPNNHCVTRQCVRMLHGVHLFFS